MRTFLLLILFSASIFAELQVNEKKDISKRIDGFKYKQNQLFNEEDILNSEHQIEQRFADKENLRKESIGDSNPTELQKIKDEENALDVPQYERDALIALYNSTNGANWIDNTNWLTSEPVENWYGVYVVDNNVNAIYLWNNNLSGTIPIEIGDLSLLEYLDLGYNQLIGTIPSQLGNLTSLVSLDLLINQLTGTIPLEIGYLTILEYLNLGNNQLTGNIPTEIGNLTQLSQLYLSSNQLEGNIPSVIGNLTSLIDFSVRSNQLEGNIPSVIGNLTLLEYLNLSSNQLTGNIPSVIGNLTQLSQLYLSSNQLSGSIPLELGNLTLLEYLYLYDNQLTGSIPQELGNLTQLRELNLSSNQLSGNIPSQIGNLTQLETLNLRINLLDSSIPQEIGNLTSLFSLNIRENQLSGSIPSQIGNLTLLEYLYLYDNQLTGPIPTEIGDLTQLKVLNIRTNQLTGMIPVEIGNLSLLVDLNLGNNSLTGSIPPEIGNLDSLSSLSLNYNQLNGTIPAEIGELNKVVILYLDHNKLIGSIPQEIGNLQSVKTLVLWDNQLTGFIPPEIGNLAQVTYLDLDVNQLSGSIPEQIGNLGELNSLWLSNNQLSGTIPSEIGNLDSLSLLYLYANQLSGNIPSSMGSLSKLTRLSIHHNQLSGTIPNEIFNLYLLEGLFLNNNELNGSVPTQINNLHLLQWIELDSNDFDELADMSSLKNIFDLYINGNKFTFEDIIPNIYVASDSISYAPQDSVGNTQEITLNTGDVFNTSVTVGGTGNKYQWKKDDVIISGATNSSYSISSVSSSDNGSYSCEITNDAAPLLTLYSKPVNLTVSSIIIVFEPSVTTTAATNITTNSARLNGTVNPNGTTTNYSFEYGISTSYGSTVTNGSELNGNEDFVVHYDLTGLVANTTYHYRITASNAGGITNGSDQTFTTNSSGNDIDLEWRTLSVVTFDWETGILLNSTLLVRNNGNTASGAHESQLFLSVDKNIESSDIALGDLISFPSIPAGDSVSVSTSFTVPSAMNGIYYIGAIVDINNVIFESNENNNNYYRTGKIIVGYPSTIQLSSSLAFSDATLSSSFRMIGLPGDNNQSIAQVLGGTFNEDWVAYYDNGNTSNYLISYDGSSTFNFIPGKGFWILSKNNLNINTNVNVVSLESNFVSSGTSEIFYSIALHSGWNIISNPFETNVAWSTVQLFNSISESIHSFSGSFSTSSVMAPYTGYYFYNATNLTSLQIPYSSSSNLTKNVVKLNNTDQFLELSTIFEENRKSSIIIGHNENALNSYDPYDRFAPPGDFEDVRISILNQQIETPYKYLRKDYRKLDKNQTFDLVVKKGIIDILELNAEGANNISAEAIYLVDHNFTFHDLRSKERILLKSSRENINLKILIGDSEYIDNERKLLIPKSISLNQNYPNPFNPSTTIEYSIPEKSIVELKVFDLLGKEISTLVNREMSPGKYELLFDASELTSGVYFYKLRIGNFIDTKKMMFLK